MCGQGRECCREPAFPRGASISSFLISFITKTFSRSRLVLQGDAAAAAAAAAAEVKEENILHVISRPQVGQKMNCFSDFITSLKVSRFLALLSFG